MSISGSDIQKLASLARINISPEEEATFAAEIDSILGYVDQLNTISGTEVGAPTAPFHRNQLREDVSHTQTNPDPTVLVEVAPASLNGLFKVKKILN